MPNWPNWDFSKENREIEFFNIFSNFLLHTWINCEFLNFEMMNLEPKLTKKCQKLANFELGRIDQNPKKFNFLTSFGPFWAFAMHVARDHSLCHASKSCKKEEKTSRALWKPIEIQSRNATYATLNLTLGNQRKAKGQSLDETVSVTCFSHTQNKAKAFLHWPDFDDEVFVFVFVLIFAARRWRRKTRKKKGAPQVKAQVSKHGFSDLKKWNMAIISHMSSNLSPWKQLFFEIHFWPFFFANSKKNPLLAQKARGRPKTGKISAKCRNSEQASIDTFAGAQSTYQTQGQVYSQGSEAEKTGKSKLQGSQNWHFQFRFWLFLATSGNLHTSTSQKYIEKYRLFLSIPFLCFAFKESSMYENT